VVFKESTLSDRVYQKLASGEGAAELVVDNAPEQLDDMSPDGKYLVFSTRAAKTNRDIVLLPLDGSHKTVPFAASVANETQAQISSDGKWIAYLGDERHDRGVRSKFSQPRRQTPSFHRGRRAAEMAPRRQGTILPGTRWETYGGDGFRKLAARAESSQGIVRHPRRVPWCWNRYSSSI